MLEFLEHGTNNILCLQPFGCLPNHVVGRGAFKAVRRQRSEANIMALDYDPGSSEANQLNRIRLFMAIAREKEKEGEEAARHARHTYAGAMGERQSLLAAINRKTARWSIRGAVLLPTQNHIMPSKLSEA